jgi:hypothetical protein
MGSRVLPRSDVISPTQAGKSSRMCARQWRMKLAGDQRAPASVSAVSPPADVP